VHGIEMERLHEARTLDVEFYRVLEPRLASTPAEGRVPVSATFVAERRSAAFPAGTVRVSTDQPLGTLAMMLLEPAAPDSFFRWGFFHAVLARTEYVEAYIMEPTARRMLAEDPALGAAFERALAEDPTLAADPQARLQWFYRRTPFPDERWRVYPVAREIAGVR
jgi:hypothetical protein